MNKIEVGEQYFIPIPDTDANPNWQQKCEIPVIHTELRIGSVTLQYLRFPIIPGKPSLLDILAGGENLEITGASIRTQMMHRLEFLCDTLQKPNPPLNARLEFQRISWYFSPHNNGSNVQS